MSIDALSGREPRASRESDRTAPLAAVIQKLPGFRDRYGITRVADTTHLDRIGVPTMSAFVPRSPDVLGVYSGKGLTRDEALVSAIMEATERQVCATFAPPSIRILPNEIERHIDLREVGHVGPEDRALHCVEGRNLITGECIPVPLGLVNPFAELADFSHWTTNGLAAGSSTVEALYHALFEVVERHLWSCAEIEASVWPRLLHAAFGKFAELPPPPSDPQDDAAASEVALPTGEPEIDELVRAIIAAHVSVRLFAFVDEAWPVAMFACLNEVGTAVPMVHAGTGCSWSPRRAATAAITEAVSSRVIEIQGAREDLKPKRGQGAPTPRHWRTDGLPTGRWFVDAPAPRVHFRDLPDRASDDLCVDVRRLLDVIRAFGLGSVAMVDLSPPDAAVHVVRIVAPGLERFIVDGSMTARTKRKLAMPFAV